MGSTTRARGHDREEPQRNTNPGRDLHRELVAILAHHERRTGRPCRNLPPDPAEAAHAWVRLQEPCDFHEEPRCIFRREKESWTFPYIDRVKLNLHAFLALQEADQCLVIGGVQDGVPWRGDSMSFYRILLDQTRKYREMTDAQRAAYRRDAARSARERTERDL